MDKPTIIVPTDLSACANSALPPALAMARALDAEILFLHVAELPFNYAGFGLSADALVTMQQDIQETVDRELDALKQQCEGIVTRDETRPGNAALEIVAVAERENAAMIIMATHGYTGLRRWWLGSTTDRVLRTAPCQVLSVRPPEDGEELPRTFRKILVPTDFSDDAQTALPIALDLAERQNDAEIVLVHVETPNDYVAFDVALTTKSEYHDQLAAKLQEMRDEIGDRVTCRTQLLHGDVETELSELAAREKADLIVISSHGRTGARRLVLGSNTARLACAAPCPVLTVRAEVMAET